MKSALRDEQARCQFLHRLFEQVEARLSAGITFAEAIRRAGQRRNIRAFKHGKLSRGSLIRLFYSWRKNRSPAAFLLHYKPGKTRIPVALAEEFLSRLAAERVVSAATVMHSLRTDWRLGRSVPGLGTWRDYVRRK